MQLDKPTYQQQFCRGDSSATSIQLQCHCVTRAMRQKCQQHPWQQSKGFFRGQIYLFMQFLCKTFTVPLPQNNLPPFLRILQRLYSTSTNESKIKAFSSGSNNWPRSEQLSMLSIRKALHELGRVKGRCFSYCYWACSLIPSMLSMSEAGCSQFSSGTGCEKRKTSSSDDLLFRTDSPPIRRLRSISLRRQEPKVWRGEGIAVTKRGLCSCVRLCVVAMVTASLCPICRERDGWTGTR